MYMEQVDFCDFVWMMSVDLHGQVRVVSLYGLHEFLSEKPIVISIIIHEMWVSEQMLQQQNYK